MKPIIIAFLLLTIFACNRKPFVNHKIEFVKVSDNCKDQQGYFNLNSNFGGERYEFEKCLSADFKKADFQSSRSNDTIFLNFPKPAGTGNVVYHVTVDIDAYPAYHFITIGEDTYQVGASK
jgi:hypothetical protein